MKLTSKQLRARFMVLKTERALWDSHYQEVANFVFPRKSAITYKPAPGQKLDLQLLDNTAVQSNELLAGALHGLLTNPNSIWFELTTGDEDLDNDDSVRLWLQKSGRRMHNALNNSNFQTEIHELYLDLCAFGIACMSAEEDSDTIVRFSTKFIGEYYVAENNKGLINEVHRTFKWTPPQLVQEYGFKNLPKKIQDAFSNSEDCKFEILHAVYPDIDAKSKSKMFKYISQTIVLDDTEAEISVKGFKEFPYLVPRWAKASGETYGRGPGMTALPEAKILNKMVETVIRGAQKVVDPPLQMPDEGFIGNVKITPGGINYYRAGTSDRIMPILNDARIDFGFQAMDLKQKKIREAFYVDQLQLQTGPQMTATEVNQRTEEKMRLLGPMLGRQQSEFLRPLISRLFNIMYRQKKLDTPPAILSGKNLDVQYVGVIAKAQKVSEGDNIQKTFQAIAPIAQVEPDVVDNFDGDKMVKILAKTYGFPQDALRSQADIKKMRDAKAQAQQDAVKQQNEQHQADLVAKAGPSALQAQKQLG